MMTQNTKKPGRPLKKVNWPKGQFSIESLATSNSIHRMTAAKKINEGLVSGAIIPAGQRRGKGKPANLYSAV